MLILFLGTSVLNAQRPKLYQVLDSSEIHLSNYLLVGGTAGSGEVDPDDIDFDQLNTLVFNKINNYRRKRHARELAYDSTADKMAYYNSLFSSNSSFDKPVKGRHKFMRELKRTHKYQNLPYGIFKTGMTQRYAMEYKGKGPYFYYDELGDLVYGRRSDVNDDSFEAKPVQHFTYESLAEILFNDLLKANKREMASKYHKVMSVRIMYYDRTKKENRIPIIRASVVYGAPRLAGIKN